MLALKAERFPKRADTTLWMTAFNEIINFFVVNLRQKHGLGLAEARLLTVIGVSNVAASI